MPIDPRIPLMGVPAPRSSPFELLGQVAQLQQVRDAGEARRLAAEEARTKHLRQKQLGEAYQQAYKVDEEGNVTIDYGILARHLPPDLVPNVIDEHRKDLQSALELDEARTKHLASRMQTVIAAGGDPTIFDAELREARRLGAIDNKTYAQVSQLKSKEQILPLAQAYVQRAQGAPKLEKITRQNEQGQTVEEFVVPQAGVQYVQPPKAGAAVSYQDVEMLLEGKPARVGYNPQTNTFHYQGQDVTARVRPMPQTVDPTLAALRQLQLQQAQQGRSPGEITTFNQIAGQMERSPLMRAADRTGVLENAVGAIRRNPSDPAAQLQLAYAYIQALDTYQSAVREGELQNLGVLGTKWEQLKTEANRYYSTGAFMPPEVAKRIADNADQIAQTIAAGATRKRQEFKARAKASGVGDLWEQFESALPPAPGTSKETSTTGGPSFGGSYQDYLRRQQQGKK